LRKKSLGVTASVTKPDDFTGLRVGYLEVSLSHAHILSLLHDCTPLGKRNRQDLAFRSATLYVNLICHGGTVW
jgi:hypothetical protein